MSRRLAPRDFCAVGGDAPQGKQGRSRDGILFKSFSESSRKPSQSPIPAHTSCAEKFSRSSRSSSPYASMVERHSSPSTDRAPIFALIASITSVRDPRAETSRCP